MSVIKIFEENNLVFLIPYFTESKSLSELRRQLEKDGFERPDSYHFNFHGVKISEYQEQLVNIKDVTTAEPSCDNRNILKLDISTSGNEKSPKPKDRVNIGKRKYDECQGSVSEPENSSKLCTSSYVCEAGGNKDLETQRTSECAEDLPDDSSELAELHQKDGGDLVKGKSPIMTVGSFLRSPKPWEVKGIKIYSPQEVDTAVGYEKQRREFWNQEAKKLSRSMLSREQIAKCINEHWRKEKATILQNQLEAKLTSAGSGVHQATPNAKKTVSKNLERVNKLRDEITGVEENILQIENGKNTGGMSLSRLKQQKSSLMSQLKKAQDCMRKNLKQI